MNRKPWLMWSVVALGYVFLYVPIVSVIVYSFSASRLATVWGGFSTRWYSALLQNEQILEALGRSLVIAAVSATAAVALGTASGLALSRFGRFPGRGLLSLDNPHLAADHFFSLLKGGAHFRLLIGCGEPLEGEAAEHHVQDAVQLFLRAYRS